MMMMVVAVAVVVVAERGNKLQLWFSNTTVASNIRRRERTSLRVLVCMRACVYVKTKEKAYFQRNGSDA